MVKTYLKEASSPVINEYEFRLAVSSDSLYVIDKEGNSVQCIRPGIDFEGLVVRCDDEDEFLDIIHFISNTIDKGINVWSVVVIY